MVFDWHIVSFDSQCGCRFMDDLLTYMEAELGYEMDSGEEACR
jgi:hypothetical protein